MSETAPRIGDLVIQVPGVDPHTSILKIGDLFLEPVYEPLLSMPLIEDGRVAGLISRYQMMQVLFRQFGRELFGRRPVQRYMRTDPVVVEADLSLEEAADIILDALTFPVTEDFVIVRDGVYLGMGVVMRLIQALQRRLGERSRELAAALADLKASESQLIQSEKMASLGQMVAGIAHEINTPLGYVRNNMDLAEQFFQESRAVNDAVFGFIDLMLSPDLSAEHFDRELEALSRLRDESDLAAFSEDIEKLFADTRFGIGEISKLVRGLKDFSRLDRAVEEQVDLHECLENALLLANNVLKDKVTVHRDYGDLPAVACCPSEINQVLLNMLSNAAQAMEGRGEIRLTTRDDGDRVRIVIADSGRGIPEEVLPRIFDPFFTTKKVGEGTGLGLSISYKIIQQHGGHIDVVSRNNEGTTFTITLPGPGADGAREVHTHAATV